MRGRSGEECACAGGMAREGGRGDALGGCGGSAPAGAWIARRTHLNRGDRALRGREAHSTRLARSAAATHDKDLLDSPCSANICEARARAIGVWVSKRGGNEGAGGGGRTASSGRAPHAGRGAKRRRLAEGDGWPPVRARVWAHLLQRRLVGARRRPPHEKLVLRILRRQPRQGADGGRSHLRWLRVQHFPESRKRIVCGGAARCERRPSVSLWQTLRLSAWRVIENRIVAKTSCIELASPRKATHGFCGQQGGSQERRGKGEGKGSAPLVWPFTFS